MKDIRIIKYINNYSALSKNLYKNIKPSTNIDAFNQYSRVAKWENSHKEIIHSIDSIANIDSYYEKSVIDKMDLSIVEQNKLISEIDVARESLNARKSPAELAFKSLISISYDSAKNELLKVVLQDTPFFNDSNELLNLILDKTFHNFLKDTIDSSSKEMFNMLINKKLTLAESKLSIETRLRNKLDKNVLLVSNFNNEINKLDLATKQDFNKFAYPNLEKVKANLNQAKYFQSEEANVFVKKLNTKLINIIENCNNPITQAEKLDILIKTYEEVNNADTMNKYKLVSNLEYNLLKTRSFDNYLILKSQPLINVERIGKWGTLRYNEMNKNYEFVKNYKTEEQMIASVKKEYGITISIKEARQKFNMKIWYEAVPDLAKKLFLDGKNSSNISYKDWDSLFYNYIKNNPDLFAIWGFILKDVAHVSYNDFAISIDPYYVEEPLTPAQDIAIERICPHS